jgi:hypothetical protein
MAFTLSQLNALDAAIATGTLSVTYDGKQITYRSTDDLMKARKFVHGELVASGQIQVPSQSNRGPSSLAIFSRD